jgi:hypothetical protein
VNPFIFSNIRDLREQRAESRESISISNQNQSVIRVESHIHGERKKERKNIPFPFVKRTCTSYHLFIESQYFSTHVSSCKDHYYETIATSSKYYHNNGNQNTRRRRRTRTEPNSPPSILSYGLSSLY